MAQTMSSRGPFACMRRLIVECQPKRTVFQHLPRRNLVTIQRGVVEKLELPESIPKQFWAQLPARLRPDRAKREIIIHEAPASEREVCKDPVAAVDAEQHAHLDPNGSRRRLFDRKNRDGARPGDILLTTFKSGEPFSGIIMSIKHRGPHTSVLLRNHLTRVGTEMHINVFSPLVQSMEIAQKSIKRRRRARLYYLRKPKHDVGSVQKIVDTYLRQRAVLTGGGSRNRTGPTGTTRRK